MSPRDASRYPKKEPRKVFVWDIAKSIRAFMNSGCQTCGGPLEASGGIVKYCSKGKGSCRANRHRAARFRARMAAGQTDAAVAMLNRRALKKKGAAA